MPKPYYSKKVIEHFLHPRNFGKMKNPSAIGKVGNPACGDVMEMYLRIGKKNNQEVIKDIKFHTMGCAAAIATSDMACELVKGKTIQEAQEIDYQDIVKKLGDLPPIKIHCSVLAKQGLKAAIEDYYKKKKRYSC